MKGILPDNNLTGQFRVMIQMLEGETWREIWKSLALQIESFSSVGLDREASDQVLWQVCQEKELVLITGNRSSHDPDSLEATIRAYNQLNSLPVITLADTTRLTALRKRPSPMRLGPGC